jgi:HEPN domain-containing protein/predicted nucleotidyltransferase
MVTQKDIQATCDDIVREFAPLQIILFGSYAYGTPSDDSDVDLLVVMDIPESETRRQAVEIQERIPRRFSMDLLVRSSDEMAFRISHNDWFLREITERGKILFGNASFFTKPFKKKEGDMNPLTLEWIEKAEGDYITVKLLEESPISSKDVICFHAQQCIEKYLKAWLQEANIPVPRTHNLEDLLNLIIPTFPAWSSWHPDFSTLSKHAVDFRYPGKSATANDAEHAMKICVQVREAVRETLKLS